MFYIQRLRKFYQSYMTLVELLRFLRKCDLNQDYLEHKSLIVLIAVAILLKIFVIMVEKRIDVAKSYGK